MKITAVEPIGPRAAHVETTRADGTQGAFLVRVHTDEGVVGIGEADTSPSLARTMIEMPSSHLIGRGLREVLIGEDPLQIDRLWYVMYRATYHYGRAGVALDTVYASVGPKPALFRHLIETAISGGDQPVPAEARAYVQQIHAEPDPGLKLELYAHSIREIQERLAPLFQVLQHAAPTDPQLDALWREIGARRAANMRLLAAELEATGGLRADLSINDAADIIWATNSSEFFLLLVHDRNWDAGRFEQWLARTWKELLLKPPT